MNVYVIASDSGCVKVGRAINPLARMKIIASGSPSRLTLARVFPVEGEVASQIERAAHIALDRHRLNGEWFNTTVAEASNAVTAALLNFTLPDKDRADLARADSMIEDGRLLEKRVLARVRQRAFRQRRLSPLGGGGN